MQLTLTCPHCRRPLSAAAGPTAYALACPHCRNLLTVPATAPAVLLPRQEEAFATLSEPTAKQGRYKRYNAEARGLSFAGTVAAIVVAFLIVSAIGWAVWYTQVRRPYLHEMHSAEILYSIRVDEVERSSKEFEEANRPKGKTGKVRTSLEILESPEYQDAVSKGVIRINMLEESKQAFIAKYGREPRYLAQSER